MTDEHNESGGPDRSRINAKSDQELRDWAKKFNTTSEQLKDAVEAVGDCAADVEMHLKGTHATTNADQEKRGEALP